MTNQLTQEELIDLAKQAGFKETVWSNILGVKVESLAKFAQLIQERQADQFVDANKMVAQALEKAAGILDSRAKEWDNIPDYGCSYAGELRFNARAIRALIAKPIEQVQQPTAPSGEAEITIAANNMAFAHNATYIDEVTLEKYALLAMLAESRDYVSEQTSYAYTFAGWARWDARILEGHLLLSAIDASIEAGKAA